MIIEGITIAAAIWLAKVAAEKKIPKSRPNFPPIKPKKRFKSYSIDSNRCVNCGTCASICPTDAINEDISFRTIDSNSCINCGTCDVLCPATTIKDEYGVYCTSTQDSNVEIFEFEDKIEPINIAKETTKNKIFRKEIIKNKNNFDTYFYKFNKKEWQTFCSNCHWKGYDNLSKKELKSFIYEKKYFHLMVVQKKKKQLLKNQFLRKQCVPKCHYLIDETLIICSNCKIKFER